MGALVLGSALPHALRALGAGGLGCVIASVPTRVNHIGFAISILGSQLFVTLAQSVPPAQWLP